ncbi:polyphosphate kinase 1 [uncultured Treponema sp.]|uniref:polyphosphate kinase 1 n=1 Tax=uncultured Treponema sp. TaxID=162155 RepID=UPI0028E1E474|nr:polyphosphate kinase 1 [uncultured Treponema sp.]
MMDYLNRELSWIDFNERVLAEACSSSVPLLERLKFIGIVSSNFDEFFMVRVAGLQEFYKSGHPPADADDWPVETLLEAIVQKTRVLFDIQEAVLNTEILPQLKAHGFAYCKPEECSEAERRFLKDYFYRHLYPIITPQVSENEQALADSVANVRLHVGFLLSGDAGKQDRLAIVPVPSAPRFVFLLPDGGLASAKGEIDLSEEGATVLKDENEPPINRRKKSAKKVEFVLIDELIRYFGGAFFSGCRITGTGIFKINRSASMTVDDSSDDGFIEALEEVLIRRRYSFVVRMTSTHESPAFIKRMSELFQLGEKDVYLSEAPIGLSSFAKITEIDGFKRLKNEKWKHFAHPAFPSDGTLWDSIKARDILLHVPYQSYKSVIRLLSDAAEDPAVTTIRMTLYRTSKSSPVVRALVNAAKRGKQVTVFVELKARFDEERNLGWVKRLQKHGVRVVYDLPHLKVHAKLLLIMRREGQGEQGYLHLSTGNYNDTTARLYADISLFTVNPRMIADAHIIFSRLCGKYTQEAPRYIITAPDALKRTLLGYIEREIDFARQHKPARIIAKMNSLSHPELIAAIYKASQAGVRIDLNVRGICMLIPGQRGISENVRVVSIIDRYLEHSRIFYFENGGDPEWYLSSADWMPRNLERRVELLFPVLDKQNQKLLDYFFSVYFADNVKAFEMQPDGSWHRKTLQQGQPPVRAQEALHRFFESQTAD